MGLLSFVTLSSLLLFIHTLAATAETTNSTSLAEQVDKQPSVQENSTSLAGEVVKQPSIQPNSTEDIGKQPSVQENNTLLAGEDFKQPYIPQNSTSVVDEGVNQPSFQQNSTVGNGEEKRKLTNGETGHLLNELLENMDFRVRPNVDGAPVVVKCGVFIISFGSISEADMDWSMDIFLRQQWRDDRLAFPAAANESGTKCLSIASSLMERIWTPDTFFPLEKSASFHDVTMPNKLMKVWPNGDVMYSIRLTLTMACPMQLSHFPLDHQICNFTITSYSHDLDELVLQWASDDPVEIEEDIELPQFTLIGLDLPECLSKEHRTVLGRFSCLTAQFHLKREYGFFLLQTYVPSILIVIISWVSFWVSKDAVPARMSLGVTTVLTMATQLSGSKSSIPRIAYPKAIDVWMVTCMIFVFGALVEYAFTNNLSRKQMKRIAARTKVEMIVRLEDGDAETHLTGDRENGIHRKKHPSSVGPPYDCYNCPRCIPDFDIETVPPLDKISRWLFPLAFLLFNLVYWPYYTSK